MRPALTVASNYGRFLVGMASVAIVTPQAIAALGIERFGLWSLSAAACGFIALLELGIATTSMRFASESEGAGDSRARNVRLSTLLFAQLPLAALMLLVGWFGAAPLAAAFGLQGVPAGEFVAVVHLGSTVAACVLPLALWRAALAARGYLHVANFIDAFSIAAGACVSLFGLARGTGVMALAWGAAATLLLPAPLLLIATRRYVPDLSLGWHNASRAEWRHMRSFAGAAVSSNTANLAAQRLEPALVNAFLPLGAVGQYSIAARIAEYALLLGRQLSSALTPVVARAHGAGDSNAIRTTLVMGTRFQVALMMPSAFLLAWHAPAVLHAWLGAASGDAYVPLRLLCVALAFAAVAMNPAICLGMTGQHRYVAQAALGGAALRLAAGAMLMSFLGLVGAGIAAIVAALAVDIGCVVTRACRHIGVPLGTFYRQAIGPTLPGLLGAAATTVVLEAWRAPVSLAAIAAQGGVAMTVFVALFAIYGLPREVFRRGRKAPQATEGVLIP
jgi:O-antigen/teichoic acid export membrane protein